MIELTTLLAGLFAITCGILAIVHSKKAQRVTLLDWSILAIGGMYGVGWILVLHVTNAGGNPKWASFILPFDSLYLAYNISSFLLLFGLLSGWYISASLFPATLRNRRPPKHASPTRWCSGLWLLLILAALTQIIYSHAYGGLLGQLEYSALIRSARFDAVPNNPFSFLRPFGNLAMIAAFGFFGLQLSGNQNMYSRLGFAISFIVSLYVLYTMLGRVSIIVFVATFPLALAMIRIRSPRRLIILGPLFFATFLIGVYLLSLWLNIKAKDNMLEFLTKEIAFPFGSFFTQLHQGEHLSRFFYDFVLSPVYLLPSSLWGSLIETAGDINTTLIKGAPKGKSGVTGAVPTDLLTLGIMQLHLPGVAFVGGLLGVLLRFLDNLLNRINHRGIRKIFEANIALEIAILGIFYSQPNQIVSSNIHWVVAALIFIFMYRLPKLRIGTPLKRVSKEPLNKRT